MISTEDSTKIQCFAIIVSTADNSLMVTAIIVLENAFVNNKLLFIDVTTKAELFPPDCKSH